ncbi:MAG TPA: universal stress protein [Candidatus Marinimicrobia bacterium]|jgi:nucleotide-binding universal stress UspA family protein|nr:universal stress protein [Candidatus Neomarinimicrobiota bacterium]
MKILIAVSSKEYSGPTLDVGMNIARALKASTTIVDVGQKISEFSSKDVSLANELMESWDLDRPGVDVLEWAYTYLAENKFIESQTIEAGFPKNLLVESGSNRAEVYLKGSVVENLNLILRNGDIIEELRDEVQTYNYDVTIIGGSGKRSMAHDLIQYIDSSIFIVNNFNVKQDYRILLAVDDSSGTAKAVKYGVRVAQAFGIDVDLVTISRDDHFGEGYKNASARAAKLMRRSGVAAETLFKVGEPVNTIVEIAGNNHIIIMGASTQSPIAKFFMGSKPLNVIEACKCPVLIVK